MTTCDKGSIIDVECIYEDGKYIIGTTDVCATDLFTIRFRAPADYKAGDVMVFRKEELPVRTPGMVGATSDIFRAGAIVHADIDLVSRRAFVWMGGVGGALPNLSYEEQFAGFYDVDGGKVYVKLIDLGAFPDSPDRAPYIKNIDPNIANLKEIVDMRTRVKSLSGSQVMFGNQSDMVNSCQLIQVNEGKIQIFVRNYGASNHMARVQIYYTCTDR